jgi:copper chaperone CopZ
MKNISERKRARLKLTGATCPSCTHAIQHAGKKLKGVENVEVDPVEKIIDLDYSGSEDAVEAIRDLVDRLGYSAEKIE